MDSEIRAIVKGNQAMLSLPDGSVESIVVGEGEDVRAQIVRRSVTAARLLGDPVTVYASGDIGDVELRIAADGSVTVAGPDAPSLPMVDEARSQDAVEPGMPSPEGAALWGPPRTGGSVPSVRELMTDLGGEHPRWDHFTRPPLEEQTPLSPLPDPAQAPSAVVAEAEPMLRRTRRTFIDPHAPVQVQPASGWRRAAAAFGVKVSASPKEIAREQDRRVVSAHHGGCRRQAVGNGKGGVGKSMTTAMLAAVYAREGGGGVLAWDNNPTRGSLGWRTESASHDATVQDLLDNAGRLLDPNAPRALMDEFVHHQRDDRYDVLRSNPELLAIRQQINADEFDLISQVVDRHYRHVVFDSGNDESAARWLRMIDLSHQLIVPTTASADSAESGMLLLQELSERDEHSQRLAQNAVVVLTHTERKIAPTAGQIRAGFEDFGATVVEIPFDPALKSVQLRFGLLARQTQDAWLRVAAAATARF